MEETMLYNFLIFEANQNIISSLRQKYNLIILLTRKKKWLSSSGPLQNLDCSIFSYVFFLNLKEKYLLC